MRANAPTHDGGFANREKKTRDLAGIIRSLGREFVSRRDTVACSTRDMCLTEILLVSISCRSNEKIVHTYNYPFHRLIFSRRLKLRIGADNRDGYNNHDKSCAKSERGGEPFVRQ